MCHYSRYSAKGQERAAAATHAARASSTLLTRDPRTLTRGHVALPVPAGNPTSGGGGPQTHSLLQTPKPCHAPPRSAGLHDLACTRARPFNTCSRRRARLRALRGESLCESTCVLLARPRPPPPPFSRRRRCRMNGVYKWGSLATIVLQNTAFLVVAFLSRNEDSGPAYLGSVAVVLTEVLKAVVCVCGAAMEIGPRMLLPTLHGHLTHDP